MYKCQPCISRAPVTPGQIPILLRVLVLSYELLESGFQRTGHSVRQGERKIIIKSVASEGTSYGLPWKAIQNSYERITFSQSHCRQVAACAKKVD